MTSVARRFVADSWMTKVEGKEEVGECRFPEDVVSGFVCQQGSPDNKIADLIASAIRHQASALSRPDLPNWLLFATGSLGWWTT